MRSTTTKRYPLSRTIQEISPFGEIVAQWGSCAECAADIGVHTAQLYKNTRNGWRTKKRIFAFADLPDNQEPVAKRPRPTDPNEHPSWRNSPAISHRWAGTTTEGRGEEPMIYAYIPQGADR